MQSAPLLISKFRTIFDTWDVDAALEHEEGPINVCLQYIVNGQWWHSNYADCHWSYARNKIAEIMQHTDHAVVCIVMVGKLHEQTFHDEA